MGILLVSTMMVRGTVQSSLSLEDLAVLIYSYSDIMGIK